jgi:hypothetical protein
MVKSKKSRKTTRKRTRKTTKRRTIKGGRAVRPTRNTNQRNNILYNPNNTQNNTQNTQSDITLDHLIEDITSEEGYDIVKQNLADMLYNDILGFEKHAGYGLRRYGTFEEYKPHVRTVLQLQEGEYETLLERIYNLYNYLSFLDSMDDDGESLLAAHGYLQSAGLSD